MENKKDKGFYVKYYHLSNIFMKQAMMKPALKFVADVRVVLFLTHVS